MSASTSRAAGSIATPCRSSQLQEAPSICFVSANSWDAQAAAQFGFQAVRVDRFGLKDDRIPGKPAAVIADLTGLAALL